MEDLKVLPLVRFKIRQAVIRLAVQLVVGRLYFLLVLLLAEGVLPRLRAMLALIAEQKLPIKVTLQIVVVVLLLPPTVAL